MRFLIFFTCTLLSINSFGQSQKEQIEKLQSVVIDLEQQIDTMRVAQIEMNMFHNKSTRIREAQIAKLKAENSQLRSIMRGYVYLIDSLNTVIEELHFDLDEGMSDPSTHDGIVVDSNPNNVTTGQSNNSNSSLVVSDNPFANGGSGNDFGDDSAYDAGGIGGDGPGTGNGSNMPKGASRKRLNDVSLVINYDTKVEFCFKVTIDAHGNVISAVVVKGRTTTTDQALINKMRTAIIQQVKYSEAPGTNAVVAIYTFTFLPK